MGWFDEQIKQRKQIDNEVFEESFAHIAGSVLGRGVASSLGSDSAMSKDAIEEILRFYHIKPKEVPDNIKDVDDQLEFLLRPSGIMRRTVILEKGWHRDAMGAMLAVRKSDGRIVALVPKGIGGYSFFDTESGKRIRVTNENEGLFEKDAMAFYLPFPLKELKPQDIIRYICGILSVSDYVMILLASLLVATVGLLTPKLQNVILDRVVASGDYTALLSISIFLICVTVSTSILTALKGLLSARIETKLSMTVEAATMMRVLSLPTDFFKQYSAGELASRTACVNTLCSMMTESVLQSGLTAIFSLVYVTQIFAFSPSLVAPAMYVVLATLVFSIVTAVVQYKVSLQEMELSGKESGVSYAIISGIQKIKLAGAEKRAFARWGKSYAKVAELQYNPPTFLKINSAIGLIITLAGEIAIYYNAFRNGVSVADYFAFNTAYGMLSGAFLEVSVAALVFAQIKPIMDMIRPIMKTVPEVSEGKQVISRLSGSIELSNVSFRYDDNMPLIIDNMSLKIRPGQYVAIVGKTGCGKSTLLRLLLGFERPQKGAVYYDGKDISNIDLKSLRQRIGVVMQNGKLFQGDIFSNIAISAPTLTIDGAWEAAEMAGIADDIRKMPMGMYTMISEGSGGVSGGQRQRLMIARAIAPRPKILMFDEATSALDNLTQKKVAQSLDSLKCTRIVIAHRLSTIKQCDRIIVLDKGKIVEEGKYDELIEKNGFFAELVARQMM